MHTQQYTLATGTNHPRRNRHTKNEKAPANSCWGFRIRSVLHLKVFAQLIDGLLALGHARLANGFTYNVVPLLFRMIFLQLFKQLENLDVIWDVHDLLVVVIRSEERRVGKECRSGGSRYHR